VSAEVRQKLEAVADAQVKARGRIARPTCAAHRQETGRWRAGLGSNSASGFGAMLAARPPTAKLYVYAFDGIAYPVENAGPELAAWERALTCITAGGNTSVGVAVEQMRAEEAVRRADRRRHGRGRERRPEVRRPSLLKYREELKADPAVCFVEDARRERAVGAVVQQGRDHGGRLPSSAGTTTRCRTSCPSWPALAKMELLQEILELPAARAEVWRSSWRAGA